MNQPLEEVILFQIDRTNKVAKLHSQREMDKAVMGITIEQWILLKIIHETSPLSQKELADRSLRDPASITRTLDILGKKGFIEREAIPDNRRQYNIILTKEGDVFVDKHMKLVRRLRKQSVSGMSQEELMMLKDLLIRMQQNMS